MDLDLLQLLVEQHVIPTVPAVQRAELAHEAEYDVTPKTVEATNFN